MGAGEANGVSIQQHYAATTSGRAVVVGEDVTKVYGGEVTALQRASFEIHEGEFVSVVGPSGCGKSTLLRLVAGLIDYTEGSLRIEGRDVVGPRESTGIMFQKPTLLPWKTSLENALLPRDLQGRTTDETRARAMELLSMVGLDGFEHAYPRQLSGGMQQRVALARLLMTGADLLLLDEPFGALDEFTREHMNLELLRIHDEFGHTTMFVTHNITEALFLADRVFVMTPRPGRIAETIDVPFDRPRSMSLTRESDFTNLVFRVRKLLGEPA